MGIPCTGFTLDISAGYNFKVNRKREDSGVKMKYFFSPFISLYIVTKSAEAIRCYQCASTEDQQKPTGIWSKDRFSQDRFEDRCGVYWPFQEERNTAVECNSDESHTPGTFCVKIVKQGPRGFIWDGRWRQVFRRCASVSDTGVTGVCNWGVLENGVYWEECYCSQDSCNTASYLSLSNCCLLSAVLAIKLF